ncbi:MAG: DHA2 family efflux MFS transporter permease subunit [Lactobacillus porci]|nr:DHA2 family efflux MFS transporter permease subunit [Lactobacillus porci]
MKNTENNVAMKAVVPTAHPWLAMLPLMIGAFVGMFSETSLNIALPQLMAALKVGQGQIQWLVTGYMLVIGIVLPLSSFLTKWFSTRQLTIFALLAFICGSIVSGLGSNFGIVLLGRMVQGIGTGIILPLMFTVAMMIFPMQKLGSVNGVLALVIMFAPAIGPTLTGLILAVSSWRFVFFSFAIILAVGLLFAFTSLKNVGRLTKPKMDLPSVLLSALAFSGLIAGASFASEFGWLSVQVLVTLLVGIVCLFFYSRRQLAMKTPILNLRVFRHKNFALGGILMMLDFAVILSAMYILPQYLQNSLGVKVALTGLIMLPGGLVNALTSALAGRMYDALGAKWPSRIGFMIALLGAAMLALGSSRSAVWYVITAHIVLMIGTPLAMSPAQTSALNSLEGAESADGSTILNTMQQIIGALATALSTSFLTLGKGLTAGSMTAKFTGGVHFSLYFTIVLILLGLLVSFKVTDDGRPD